MDFTTNSLRWIVKVRHDPAPLYEPIAAFNVDEIAVKYAADCNRSNPHLTYIVEELPEFKPARRSKIIRTFPATVRA